MTSAGGQTPHAFILPQVNPTGAASAAPFLFPLSRCSLSWRASLTSLPSAPGVGLDGGLGSTPTILDIPGIIV